MTDHLSNLQVQLLCVRALPENELVALAIHTAECLSCHQRCIEELKRQRVPASFNFTLEPEFWFRNDHVDFDQLVSLADKALDDTTQQIINIHLKTCESCREDVRSFFAFRNATVDEVNISYGRPEYQTTHEIGAIRWWQCLQLRPLVAMAAIVLLVVTVLIGVIALNKRSGVLEASKHDQTSPGICSRSVFPPSAPSVVSARSTANSSARVAMLYDAGGEVVVDNNGTVTGLDEVSENSRRLIVRAAMSERIEMPDVLRRLSGQQSELRGNDNGRQRFELLYPARRVIIEDRPVFRWQSLRGVSSYRVYVLDVDGKQVSQSEELPPNQTQWKWKAPARLRRGQIFSWVVAALVDGKQVVSPSASAPEMKFAVLSAADFQELTYLNKSNSHLALGVFFARTGLLDNAEREFQSLIELNRQSELPRKLLQSVRSLKQGSH